MRLLKQKRKKLQEFKDKIKQLEKQMEIPTEVYNCDIAVVNANPAANTTYIEFAKETFRNELISGRKVDEIATNIANTFSTQYMQ